MTREITTPVFVLPNNCPVCQAVRVGWQVGGTVWSHEEEAKYACSSRLIRDLRAPASAPLRWIMPCEEAPEQKAKRARWRVLDTAVAAVLKGLAATEAEVLDFVARGERGRWHRGGADSLLAYFRWPKA